MGYFIFLRDNFLRDNRHGSKMLLEWSIGVIVFNKHMVRKIFIIALCIGSFFSGAANIAFASSHVSRDANGWTVVVPSADSRIIYVSSGSGNDSNDGLSEALPVKTLQRGMSLLRNGYPDWLTLKAGDIWNEGFGAVGDFGGRSSDEPMVITGYGNGAKPQIRPTGSGNTELFHHGGASASGHMYFLGLDFYDARKDPQSPSFMQNAPDVNGIAWIGGGNDILIENCDFRFLTDGVVFQQYDSGAITGLTLRRNRFLDGYSFNAGSFAQGAFLYGIDGLIIEENIMDHNGYNHAAGVTATVFVHNLYVNECKNVTVARNLLLRAGSLALKFRSDHALASTNTVAEDNLIFESEVGIGAAADGGVGIPAQPTLTDFTIRNNVFLQTNRDNPTGRGLGWAMSLNDIKDSSVTGNIVTDLSYTGNSFALSLGDGMESPQNYPISNITIADNIAYRVNGSGFSLRPADSWSNVSVINNDIQNPDQSDTVAVWDRDPSSSAVVFSGNRYYNKTANPASFAWTGGAASGHAVNYAGWVAASGETGSSYAAVSYPDPNRNLETYAQSLGQPATVAAFIAGIRGQTKGNWQTVYTATAVNDYIRAGFAVAPLGSTPPPAPVPVPVTYALAYTASAHGSLAGAINQTVNAGASGTAVTAVPDTGYHFVSWSDNSTQNPRTDINVTASLSVAAGFAADPVAPPSSGGGSSSGGSSSGGGGGGGSSSMPVTEPAPYSPSSEIANTLDINADKGLSGQAANAHCQAGVLIKASLPAVYYCGADGKRHVFTNDRAFFSWYSNFSSVQTISGETMASIPLGDNVTYRPGKRMVKIQTDPKVYAVAKGGVLRWVPTEAKAIELYGANWNQMIDDISDAFFVNYTIGSSL